MQGFNKYYPPNYKPEDGSLNTLNGKHALGDRARKIDQGILIVRFEMPYNIWCSGCDNHIGMGVRYNAEKSKVGKYFSTPIFNFRCKCHLCSSWFEIRTDPQNTRYVVHSGARQQNQEWDPAENGGFVLEEKLADTADPLAVLDRQITQKTKALSAAASLHNLEQLQEDRWSDPYTLSTKLRSSFRASKKVRLESEGKADVVRTKYGLGERVTIEDLRTPARIEDKVEEDRAWMEARGERKRLRSVQSDKREKEVAQAGWKSERAIARLPRRSTSTSAVGAPSKALQLLASKLGLREAIKSDPFKEGRNTPQKRARREGVVSSSSSLANVVSKS